MNKFFIKTFKDTILFLSGAIIGLFIENAVYKIHEYIDPQFTDETDIIYIGIFQIFINAYIINFLSAYLSSMGLFTFGLLSVQTFIIRETYRQAKSKYNIVLQQRERFDKI